MASPDVQRDLERMYLSSLQLVRQLDREWRAVGKPLTQPGSMGQLVEHTLLKQLREARKDAAGLARALRPQAPSALGGRPVGSSSAPDRPGLLRAVR